MNKDEFRAAERGPCTWTDDGSPRRPLIRASRSCPCVGRREAARVGAGAWRDVAFVE